MRTAYSFVASPLRRARALLGASAFMVGGLYASGCRTAAPQRDGPQPTTATLSVENNAFNDRTIYVVFAGARQRLGIAPGERTTKLKIPSTYLAGSAPLRFLADPIGGMGVERSEEITVYPGDEVVMIIEGT